MATPMQPPGFPSESHDHTRCRSGALACAKKQLAQTGARLTPDREAVLNVLLAGHQALGAYDIMGQIDWRGRRPAPSVVYRALDFLVSNGLAHKVESRNAFMACPSAGHAHKPMILVCTSCGQVAEFEAPAISRAVTRVAQGSDFKPVQTTVEVSGLCGACA